MFKRSESLDGGSHDSVSAMREPLLSAFESDAYPAELTGAVSVSVLFIELAFFTTGRQNDRRSDASIGGTS